MQESTLLALAMAAVLVVALVAKRFDFPYPIAFVIGGTLMAFIPNLPSFELNPNWVFLIFLPPLLYAGGWSTDLQLFRVNLRPILLLAIGLVAVTTVIVAAVFHGAMPEAGWAVAFTLGAIVSPPDAVAAGAIFERFSIPRRIVAILEGEGLVNDATALVIYRFAILAAVTGTFSAPQAGLALLTVAGGGVLVGVGLALAFSAIARFMRRFDIYDALLANVLFLFAPYACYLGAEALHVSGVLATVVGGAIGGWRASSDYDADSRLTGYSTWNLLIFLLNGFVFLLIGLQVREIVRDPAFALHTLWLGVTISLLVIVVRIVWVFPATYLPRWLIASVRKNDPSPPWTYPMVISWSGMRGIVSLAAALALPLRDNAGQPFPARTEIIFITFCVIFATLVFQGISLIPLLKWLKIEDSDDNKQQEIEIRIAALRAGIQRLRSLEPAFDSITQWEVEGRLLAEYEYRIAHLLGHGQGEGGEIAVNIDHNMQRAALDAERGEIMRLRDAGEIPAEIFRKIEYDLDLANARLA